MGIKIEADTSDIDKVIRGLEVVRGYFSTSAAMTPAVRAVGAGWHDNFRSEGARVGGWKPLSDYTERERIERGYRKGPKLLQSGGLLAGAITPFTRWSEGQARFNTTIAATPARAKAYGGGFTNDTVNTRRISGYGPDPSASGPTRVTAAVNPRRFFANVSGAKALNQTGGNMPVASASGWTKLTARPFWFFDQQMVDAATLGIIGRFEFYAFRYMPRVFGASQSGWSLPMSSPTRSGPSTPIPSIQL